MSRLALSARRRWLIASLACLASTALVILPGGTANMTGDAVDVSFSDERVLTVQAGLVVELSLTSSDQSAETSATIMSAAGTETVGVQITNGKGSITLGPPHTVRAGVITVMAGSAEVRSVEVTPASGEQNMDINVGPTTIGPGDRLMAVGLLTDRWGNPVIDGSAVQLTVSRAGEGHQLTDLGTRLGLAVVELSDASLDSDRFQVAMNGNGAFSEAVTIRVQPGTPESFELLRNDPSSPRADGRTRVHISSTRLADVTRQPLADGTHVVLELGSADGRSIITGEVVVGFITASFVAPEQPGDVTIVATVAGRPSAPLTVRFDPAVTSVPVEIGVVNGIRRVMVGPVVGPDGGVVPDGTPVLIGDATIGLVSGHASATIAVGTPIPAVEVLGVAGDIS